MTLPCEVSLQVHPYILQPFFGWLAELFWVPGHPLSPLPLRWEALKEELGDHVFRQDFKLCVAWNYTKQETLKKVLS